MVVTKEEFVDHINFIKEKREQEDTFCSVLESMSPETYVDAFIYTQYEDRLVKLLKQAMGLPKENEDIEYFIFELEFGTRYEPGTIRDDKGNDLDFSTSEKLYDYLVTITEDKK